MLLSEIVFLRDKKKNKVKPDKENSAENSRFLDLKSERSQELEDVEAYKEIISEMEKDMNDALQKLN